MKKNEFNQLFFLLCSSLCLEELKKNIDCIRIKLIYELKEKEKRNLNIKWIRNSFLLIHLNILN